jgi:hypothetical protein
VTLALRGRPRTGRLFVADVLVSGWDGSANGNEHQLVIGLKTTAGAPASRDDMDGGLFASAIPQTALRTNLTRSGVLLSGQLRTQGTLTHAPGANVKVYAALQPAAASDSDPFTMVSPGVLLRA